MASRVLTSRTPPFPARTGQCGRRDGCKPQVAGRCDGHGLSLRREQRTLSCGEGAGPNPGPAGPRCHGRWHAGSLELAGACGLRPSAGVGLPEGGPALPPLRAWTGPVAGKQGAPGGRCGALRPVASLQLSPGSMGVRQGYTLSDHARGNPEPRGPGHFPAEEMVDLPLVRAGAAGPRLGAPSACPGRG